MEEGGRIAGAREMRGGDVDGEKRKKRRGGWID